MDDDEAVAGLKRLGLTTYEARVMLGLQKLGSGTASDVTDVVDVPRSQVYGAADSLEERGLVETQQSTPTVYRPVSLERARTRLLDELARTGARTFEYLERVEGTATQAESSEGVWLVRGRDPVNSRSMELIREADERVLYGVRNAGHLDDAIIDALTAAADAGADVVVACADPAVLEAVPDHPGLRTDAVPEEDRPQLDTTCRVLLVDDDTMLLSVFSSATTESGTQEVAFWSQASGFASVFVEVIEQWFADADG